METTKKNNYTNGRQRKKENQENGNQGNKNITITWISKQQELLKQNNEIDVKKVEVHE